MTRLKAVRLVLFFSLSTDVLLVEEKEKMNHCPWWGSNSRHPHYFDTVYKYDALTGWATGADSWPLLKCVRFERINVSIRFSTRWLIDCRSSIFLSAEKGFLLLFVEEIFVDTPDFLGLSTLNYSTNRADLSRFSRFIRQNSNQRKDFGFREEKIVKICRARNASTIELHRSRFFCSEKQTEWRSNRMSVLFQIQTVGRRRSASWIDFRVSSFVEMFVRRSNFHLSSDLVDVVFQIVYLISDWADGFVVRLNRVHKVFVDFSLLAGRIERARSDQISFA